jgi:hypothetical protein
MEDIHRMTSWYFQTELSQPRLLPNTIISVISPIFTDVLHKLYRRFVLQGNNKWKCVDVCLIHPLSLCYVAGSFPRRRLLDLTTGLHAIAVFEHLSVPVRRLWKVKNEIAISGIRNSGWYTEVKCSVGVEVKNIVWGGIAWFLEDEGEILGGNDIPSEVLRNKAHKESSGYKRTNKGIYDIANWEIYSH